MSFVVVSIMYKCMVNEVLFVNTGNKYTHNDIRTLVSCKLLYTLKGPICPEGHLKLGTYHSSGAG